MNVRHKRSDRVADLILKELSYVLLRRIKDPRLERMTVTGVRVTDDLRRATVFYTVLDRPRDQVLAGIRSAGTTIRRELARRLALKHTPEIVYRYDTSFDHAERIDALLREIKDEPC